MKQIVETFKPSKTLLKVINTMTEEELDHFLQKSFPDLFEDEIRQKRAAAFKVLDELKAEKPFVTKISIEEALRKTRGQQ